MCCGDILHQTTRRTYSAVDNNPKNLGGTCVSPRGSWMCLLLLSCELGGYQSWLSPSLLINSIGLCGYSLTSDPMILQGHHRQLVCNILDHAWSILGSDSENVLNLYDRVVLAAEKIPQNRVMQGMLKFASQHQCKYYRQCFLGRTRAAVIFVIRHSCVCSSAPMQFTVPKFCCGYMWLQFAG